MKSSSDDAPKETLHPLSLTIPGLLGYQGCHLRTPSMTQANLMQQSRQASRAPLEGVTDEGIHNGNA